MESPVVSERGFAPLVRTCTGGDRSSPPASKTLPGPGRAAACPQPIPKAAYRRRPRPCDPRRPNAGLKIDAENYESQLVAQSPGFDWPVFDENTGAFLCYTSGSSVS